MHPFFRKSNPPFLSIPALSRSRQIRREGSISDRLAAGDWLSFADAGWFLPPVVDVASSASGDAGEAVEGDRAPWDGEALRSVVSVSETGKIMPFDGGVCSSDILLIHIFSGNRNVTET
jgi:hypothetical protein